MAKKDVLLGGVWPKGTNQDKGGEGVKKSGFRWDVLSGWPLSEIQVGEATQSEPECALAIVMQIDSYHFIDSSRVLLLWPKAKLQLLSTFTIMMQHPQVAIKSQQQL